MTDDINIDATNPDAINRVSTVFIAKLGNCRLLCRGVLGFRASLQPYNWIATALALAVAAIIPRRHWVGSLLVAV
ncbi:MAG: hypothetical protein HOP34_10260 [Methylococcaceae bacterium]|nr:hypothetical protein [Methylococcaceae bacterium]